MFDHRHYVPILKWRRGEQRALAELPATDKNEMTPLLEIPPVPWDFKNDCPKETVDKHLDDVADTIESSWDKNLPIFVDLLFIDPDERMANGDHPVMEVFARCRSASLDVVPVTALDRDSAYQDAVRDVIAIDRGGVCIRIGRTALASGAALGGALAGLLAHLQVTPADVDLVVDLAAVTEAEPPFLSLSMPGIIGTLPHLQAWRSLTLAATGFPPDLGEILPGVGDLPRHEWALWQSIANSAAAAQRVPTFGDYAIAHPELRVMDPRLMRVSASIRYTTNDRWVVFRGRNVKQHGFVQYTNLSIALVAHPQFAGRNFSEGDRYIEDCANSVEGTGNHETWRWVGTNHHVTFVVRQLASRFAASGSAGPGPGAQVA